MSAGNERLRKLALEALVELMGEMGESPVPDVATITRRQLEVLTDYVRRVKPQ